MNQIPWELIQLRTIEWVVIGILAFLFLAGSVTQRIRQQAAAMMTSVGILGTFAGIYIAMLDLDFSPANVDESVTALVNGMKTAFLTSLLGLGAAILFRITIALGLYRRTPGSSADDVLSALSAIRAAIAGKDDDSLASQLRGLRLNVKDSGSAQEKHLESLLQAVAGAGEGSIAGRLDKMRLEVAERLDLLQVVQADGFGNLKALTETIREALVENVQELIAELNESVGKEFRESMNRLMQNIERALIEQFGKTFIEFNEATQALKQWQEDHRVQVEELTEAFDMAANGIDAIAQNCERIPPTIDRLYDGVSMVREDVEALNRQLEAFASLRQQAELAFPVIKQHLDTIGDDLRESAAGFDGMKGVIEDAFREAHASAMRTMQTHAADVKEMAADMKGTVEEAQRQSAQRAFSTVETTMDEFSKQVRSQLEEIVRRWGGEMVGIANRCKQLLDSIPPPGGPGRRPWRGG